MQRTLAVVTFAIAAAICAPASAQTVTGAAATAGEKPGAVAGRKVTVVGDVIDVNATTQVVTVRGPQRTVELSVEDPEQFTRIAKGDQIEATYVEAIAVGVRPAAKK